MQKGCLQPPFDGGGSDRPCGRLFQDRLMEFVPVVEVVQVDGVVADGAFVADAAGAADALAGGVVVVVTLDGAVALVDGGLVELHAGLFLQPCLELRVGGLAFRDVFLHRVGIQAECADHHRVVALADAGITGGELAAGFEGDFLPQARQVQDTERAGGSGTDERDVGVSHRFGWLLGLR